MNQSVVGKPACRKATIVVLIACLSALAAPAKTTGSNPQLHTPALHAPQATTQQSKPAEVQELRLGPPVERELSAGETHSYKITLSAGQYVHVTTEQLGINVEVALSDPAGEQVVSVDWWWREGTESLWAAAERGGDYMLKISAPALPAETGKYRVRVEQVGRLPEASEAERDLIAAHKLTAAGESLLAQGTKESLTQASEKLQAALALWRNLKDGNAEAQTLSDLGAIQFF